MEFNFRIDKYIVPHLDKEYNLESSGYYDFYIEFFINHYENVEKNYGYYRAIKFYSAENVSALRNIIIILLKILEDYNAKGSLRDFEHKIQEIIKLNDEMFFTPPKFQLDKSEHIAQLYGSYTINDHEDFKKDRDINYKLSFCDPKSVDTLTAYFEERKTIEFEIARLSGIFLRLLKSLDAGNIENFSMHPRFGAKLLND